MKLGQIAFLFLTFGILKFMIVTTFFGTAGTYTYTNFQPPAFPSVTICDENKPFDASTNPTGTNACEATFGDISGTFGIVQATANIFVAIYIGILFLIKMLIYITLLIIYVGSLLFSTIPDAPWYINLILLAPIILIFGIIIFRLFRKGDDSA